MPPRYRIFMRQGSGGGSTDEFNRRQTLTIGTYRPDATNTGLLNDPARPLSVHEGNFTASTAGQQVRDLEIRGKLIITGANVTVDNCWVRGPATRPTGANEGLIEVNGNTLNAVIRDCFLDPRAPGSSLDGIRTRGYTAIRVRTRRNTDGFAAFPATAGQPANVQLLGCWCEPMAKFYPDTDVPGGHTDGTHNDPVQIQGGAGANNIVIRGCRLEGYIDPAVGNTGGLNTGDGGTPHSPASNHTNAVIQINDNVGQPTGVLIENNWIYGGRIALNGTDLPAATNFGSVLNNKFDHGQYLDVSQQGTNNTQTIRMNPAPTITFAGNVYEDNNVPVVIRRAV